MRDNSFDCSSVTTFDQAAAIVAADAVVQIIASQADGSPNRDVAGPLLSSLTGSVEFRSFVWDAASGYADGLGGRGGRVYPDAPAPQAVVPAPGLSKVHIPPRNKNGGILEVYRNASYMELTSRLAGSRPEGEKVGGKRSEIEDFSPASRRRMLALLAKVDNSQVPWFVTTTYPDEFERYAWDGEEIKRHIEMMSKRLERRFPGCSVVWKLEFIARKSGKRKGEIAPHIHWFVWGVPWVFEFRQHVSAYVRFLPRVINGVHVWEESICVGGDWVRMRADYLDERPGHDQMEVGEGRCPVVWNGDSFARWVARNWFDVVGSGDKNHFKAGTSTEVLRGKRGAFAYASKRYVAKPGEAVWSAKPGRFWGVVGRKNLPLGRRDILELTHDQAVRLRRVMRRYRMANCPKEKRAKMRKGQLFSRDFTVKLFAGVEFWMERLPALLGSAPRLRQAGPRRLFPLLI